MTTIADAARLARFLVAADNLARRVESYEPSEERVTDLTDYAAARKALFGEASPPGRPPHRPTDFGRVR